MSDETKTPAELKSEIADDEKKLAAIDALTIDDDPKKTIEAWAEAKGFTKPARAVDPSGRKPAKTVQVLDWRFAAAKALHKWPIGLELTESEFDVSMKTALGIAVR